MVAHLVDTFRPHPQIPELQNAPKDEYLTDRLTQESIDFIDRNRDQRWFLYLTHFAVHTPLQGRKDLVAKYEAKSKGKLHDHAVMAAMIESVDAGIGRIIRRLDELGIRQSTAIVFTSDNGGYGPATSMSPLKGYKGTYYEGGIREPMFVNWPDVIEPGSKCDVPVINVDLFPTLCAMTGADLPQNQALDGVNLVPLLRGEVASLLDRALFWHFPAYLQSYQRVNGQRDLLFRSRPCSVIRMGDWKLHEYFEDGGLELYNLKNDVGEQTNIAQSEPEKAKQLHEALVAWREIDRSGRSDRAESEIRPAGRSGSHPKNGCS